jgi:PAS domain S-box-containing protein
MSSSPVRPSASPAKKARFPEVVGLQHFIVLPALAMGAAIALSRLAQAVLLPRLSPVASQIFNVSRAIVITVAMASLIGWLVVRYRRRFELELQARHEELKEARDFLSSIIRDSAEGIVTLDVDDRITSWNRAAEGIFGWTAGEARGMSVNRLLPDDPRIVEDRRLIGERLRGGETVLEHYTTRRRKDGKSIYVRISWSPLLDASGTPVGSVGIVLDVTAQREMRERLVEQERLAAVGEMAAHVAHEIRNPLAGIRAACQVLFMSKERTGKVKEIGDEVVHQVDRLNQTVSELLQFAVPRKLETAPTDLIALIDRVISIFGEHPASRKVSVKQVMASEIPLLKVDPGQLEQVFYNLLLNAAQAMDSQGSVVISTELSDRQVLIRVRDTGPGLRPGADEKLFKPFYTTRTDGTGLGLPIVRKIVVAHGGAVTASNPAAGGAEFVIRLPLESSQDLNSARALATGLDDGH